MPSLDKQRSGFGEEPLFAYFGVFGKSNDRIFKKSIQIKNWRVKSLLEWSRVPLGLTNYIFLDFIDSLFYQ